MRGPGVTWTPYSDDALKEAARQKRPVIIDFYAAWCAPCRELDEITFHDAAVVKQARERLRHDQGRRDQGRQSDCMSGCCRSMPSRAFRRLSFSMPTGKERQDLRLVDFLPPDQLLNRMSRLQKDSS
ncbi:MAG: thioredoxin family protein [Desulfobacterales bacterium]|nr:thioredoxin family protein [Desulfobacterales bacterium]